MDTLRSIVAGHLRQLATEIVMYLPGQPGRIDCSPGEDLFTVTFESESTGPQYTGAVYLTICTLRGPAETEARVSIGYPDRPGWLQPFHCAYDRDPSDFVEQVCDWARRHTEGEQS